VLVDSAPEIYPVNHVAVGETIVFRTDPGAKLRGLVRSPAVCFEVDAVDLVARTGWSVLVKGRAEEIDAPSEGGGVDVWTLGDKAYWVRIVPAEVTGRRIHRS
jgi:nitroimidazol reductase NimA-like FMN-containing flavoprotein (pyridoxamine 5'-phosphate oxidase superfamily)